MNRRTFLSRLGLVVGGIAMEQAIPLGRVWSFPKQIKTVNMLTVEDLRAARELLGASLHPRREEDYYGIMHPFVCHAIKQEFGEIRPLPIHQLSR